MINVLIIGIGDPVPTFIHRRLRTLIKYDVNITVAASNQLPNDLIGLKYIRIVRKFTVNTIAVSFIKACVNFSAFVKMMRIRTDLTFFNRLVWALKYLPLACAKRPDIIHLQWIAAATEYSWLRNFFSSPIIASARGSMVTVYPVTRPGYRNIIEKAIQQVDYIHCVSNDMAIVCEKLGARKDQLIVNYNGLDLNHFIPSSTDNVNTIFTLISAGTLMWRKAYIYQLHIVKKLLLSGYHVKLTIIGDGPDREALVYTAKVLGISQHIELAGKLAEAELPVMLNRADIYISTSLAEGLANSVVEAVACKLPVVCFECEGMHEVIEQGVNGFIVPFGDVDGMVEKIIHLATHPDERVRMGLASRKIAEERFDENVCVQQMIKNYKSIAEKK
jgi:glycosyltransferase involved in cell wall biosynthesis